MAKKNKVETTVEAATDVAVAEATAPVIAEAAPVATASGLPANVVNVPAAPPKGAGRSAGTKGPFVNPKPRSDVANPVQVAWAVFAAQYQQHGPALTRKQATDAAMEAGVAYYTSRTQYQLWRTALLASAAQQAAAPSA